MRKSLFLLLFVFFSNYGFSQTYINELNEYQRIMNEEFSDSLKSPLTDSDRNLFKNLDFFNIDSTYRIKAIFKRTPYEIPFPMKTTTSRAPMYVKYGEANFILNGSNCLLNIYQNIDLIKKEGYANYLFLPFTDLTNGNESYGGGRYIDLKIPDDEHITIDFNKAYNPYCAYNHKYSCPIPPSENNLNIEIKAGVKKFH
jgi:uncharacterized protein (DUF1684 family)